ncbi:OLC1v1009590C1 [Oldenlandia corymbosa var. corymbosa]|uniref:OLC1v1009590C1 n=1 Tax=Oldenlandia corymbosa var. corymbosa TaxID=529605 RepID=A0AAV1DRQ2_OLDCO|nr:OLC1v1009590C1 [Oldenlandia corymbosa var. corymbosa]
MVCFHSSIPVDQHIAMAKSGGNSTDSVLKPKQINQPHKKKNQLNIPACEQSRFAVIDVIILIAVIGACGFLLYPCVRSLAHNSAEFVEEAAYILQDEIFRAPMVYGCFGLSLVFALLALLAITIYTSRTCGKPGCRGLSKAAEFDIQLETEECVKSSIGVPKLGVKQGLFQLPRDHHRELEAELKKMAPPNGRAVLVFRARCGCSIGSMEVPGPKKSRKVKK